MNTTSMLKVPKKGGVKYSAEFKIYVIIYMKLHNLSNHAAARLFLPHQKSDDTKTIRSWKQIYYEKGPEGFLKKNKSDINIKKPEIKVSVEGKSPKELQKIIDDMSLQLNAYYELTELLKKKSVKK